MKSNKTGIVKDLKSLIDMSSVEGEDVTMFELFHKMLIGILYKAVDISIDYDRKSVHMSVIDQDRCFDLETFNNPYEPTMLVNLVYKDLNTFLKSCILEDVDSLNYYYPTLISRFFKRNMKEDLESIQMA